MWSYDKKLEYPIKIKKPDPRMANAIITQYGGPDGELGASLRYLSQRFAMITPEAKATLNDIGSEVSKLPRYKNMNQLDIELYKYHFYFSGKMDKRSYNISNYNEPEKNMKGFNVRVLLGIG
jgi:hypothetical protein